MGDVMAALLSALVLSLSRDRMTEVEARAGTIYAPGVPPKVPTSALLDVAPPLTHTNIEALFSWNRARALRLIPSVR